MSETTLLDDTLALALKLSPKERIQLIERVASSVERENEPAPVHIEQPEEPWGNPLSISSSRLISANGKRWI